MAHTHTHTRSRAERAELAARDKYRQKVEYRNRIKSETAHGIRNQAFRMV